MTTIETISYWIRTYKKSRRTCSVVTFWTFVKSLEDYGRASNKLQIN